VDNYTQIKNRLWVQAFHFDAVLLFTEVLLWRYCPGPHFPKSVSNKTVSIGKKRSGLLYKREI